MSRDRPGTVNFTVLLSRFDPLVTGSEPNGSAPNVRADGLLRGGGSVGNGLVGAVSAGTGGTLGTGA